MSELQELREEIEKIKARNRRVEADKSWETSKTRTAFIATETFLLIFLVMFLLGAERPLLNALISSGAYWLSTETYGVFKSWWLKKHSSR